MTCPVSPAAPRFLTMGLLLCLSWKRSASFSHSHFLMGSALMGNCPWLNQLLPIPLTSFPLNYSIVHFSQCRAHSYLLPRFLYSLQCSPPNYWQHCQCFQVEGTSDGVETSPEVFWVPILRLVLQRIQAFIAKKSKQHSLILATQITQEEPCCSWTLNRKHWQDLSFRKKYSMLTPL